MQVLYPPIKPNAIYQLNVDSPHTLYVEESGNPNGLPVLFLHGGPGIGCSPEHRRFFDPGSYRIILFDQRGAGRSTPHAELQNNTTQALLSDIEAIRSHLSVDRWVVFGGSWGSTLALIYAQMYPQHVISLILRGIFLCRQQDIDWFYKPGGASRLFPDAYEKFLHHLPEKEREDIIGSYYRRLTGEDEVAKMGAAKIWCEWEGLCSTLLPSSQAISVVTEPHTAISMARIETHYFVNQIFLEENYILKNVDKLKDIPGVIVHGRYDVVCPLDNALELNRAWPNSRLEIIRDAGHSAFEPSILNALVAAANAAAKEYKS